MFVFLFIILFRSLTSFASLLPPGVEPSAGCTVCKSSLTFTNPEAEKFSVGTQIPLLPFKTKQSWSGNIAIPDTPTVKNGSLFFWLWGKDSIKPSRNLIIWFSGGPGCDSTSASTTENGPFLLQSTNEGQTRPNPFSWTLAADILYVNYPVGVAFTTGQRNFTNQEEISEQFILWLENFFEIFTELSHKNLWLIGESYAGIYLPHLIQTYMKRRLNGVNMFKGGMLIDPFLSTYTNQMQVPLYDFSLDNKKTLNLTQSDLKQIKNESNTCGYSKFLDKNLQYPPKGRLQTPNTDCDVQDVFFNIVMDQSDTFNIYNIKKPDPSVTDTNLSMTRDKFLNNTQVQKYIHVKEPGKYVHCQSVFFDDTDQSLPVDRKPSFKHSLLAHAIKASKRFFIMHGDLDALLQANGTRLVLQNLTWEDKQGFFKPPRHPLKDLSGKISAISTDEERGLRYIEVFNAGHRQPQDQPSFSLAAVLNLLGERPW